MAGVGRLDIGIGSGAAQVFNPSPVIQQYGQMLAQRQAKHEQEVQQLGEALSRGYDPSGLRNDADRSIYVKKFNDIQQSAIDAENEKDNTKKILALSAVRQQINDLRAFSDGSKKQGMFERQLAMEHLKNPYLYDDDTAQKILSGKDKVWDDPNIIKEASQVARGVNPEKVIASYKKLKDGLISPLNWDNGVSSKPYQLAGKTYQDRTQNRGIAAAGDNGALEHVMAWATADPDAKLYLQQAYPQIQGNNPQSTLAMRALKFMHEQGDDKGFFDKPKVTRGEAPEPDKFYAHRQYEIAHPLPAKPTFEDEQYYKKFGNYPLKGGGDNAETYRQYAIKNVLAAKQGTDKPTVVPELEQIKAQVSADPSFDPSQNFDYGWNKSGQLVIHVPAKDYQAASSSYKYPSQNIIIAPGSGADAQLNEVMNYTTGEKVSISALETPDGKKRVQAGQPKGDYQNVQSGTINGKKVKLGYKDGKWYNTETNQPME